MSIDIDKLTNGEYVTEPYTLLEKLGVTTRQDVIQALILIHRHNAKIIESEKYHLMELRHQQSILDNSPSLEPTIVVPSSMETTHEEEPTLEQDNHIAEILLQIEASDISDMYKYLPARDDPKFFNVLNQLMSTYYKEIVFYNRYLAEFRGKLSSSEAEEIKVILDRKESVFEALKDYRLGNKEEELVPEENTKPVLIHLESANHASLFCQDIEKINVQLYKHFLTIYEPFILGKPITIERMKYYPKLLKLKQPLHQARIYLTHISDNIYTVLGAINKKTTWGVLENNFINNRYTTWNLQQRSILGSLDDPSFIEKQNERTEKVLRLLKGEK